MSKARQWTLAAIAAMDEGTLDPKMLAEMALHYLSERDVKDMLLANDLRLVSEKEDEDGYDEDDE